MLAEVGAKCRAEFRALFCCCSNLVMGHGRICSTTRREVQQVLQVAESLGEWLCDKNWDKIADP